MMTQTFFKFFTGLGIFCNTACASVSRPVSDHFDGKKFFNPDDRTNHGLTDGLKVLWNFKSEQWPADMSNKHTPQIASQVPAGQVVMTFVNHATMLIQMEGINILTDPVWSKRASPVTFAGPKRRREPGVALQDLPKIDVILVSHNHYDHMDLATLKKIFDRDQPQVFVAAGDRKLAEGAGLKNIHDLDWWESVQLQKTKITYAPTQHFSARGLFDRNESLWGAYMIEHSGKKIYFGGDAGYSRFYKETRQRLGEPDIALLPIGAYEPRWFMKVVHMNPEEAVQAHLDLGARRSVAIHFGTFALTEESPVRAVKDLGDALKKNNLTANDFIVLGEGETRKFE